MNKPRLEAFTDAVIAIAATIMVLELHAPAGTSIHELLKEWPVFFAYLVSFALIYIVWYSHHNAFKKAKYISVNTYLLNGVWLFILTIAPFTTAWVGQNPNSTWPEFTYIFVQLIWSVAFHLMDNQILRDNPGVKKDASTEPTFRLVLYGGSIVALIVTFIYPIGALIISAITIVMTTVNMVRTGKSHG